MNKFKFFTLIAFIFAAGGCAKPDETTNQYGQSWIKEATNKSSVFSKATSPKVTDLRGKPIAGAKILIGSDLDRPFAHNFVATDSTGQFQPPAGWTKEETVTIDAPGYVRASFLKQKPTAQTFSLRPMSDGKVSQLTGKTLGHAVKNNDDFVDFGLVIPAVERAGFLNLDISDFIGTDTDTVSVAGKSFALPSNITLPRQEETYFIPISLDKPDYRLNFFSSGVKTVFAARGRFSLDEMINAYQSGKPMFELANSFAMLGGVVEEITLKGTKTVSNLNTAKLTFQTNVNVIGPRMRTDEMTMAVPMTAYKNTFYPTDVKNLQEGKTQKLSTNSNSGALLTLLKKSSEAQPKNMVDRMSLSFQNLKSGMTPTLLPLLANPTLKSSFEVSIPTIANLKGLHEGASYAVLSRVKSVTVGKSKIPVLSSMWEVFSPEWESQIVIPQWPGEKAPAGDLRWQVTLTASPQSLTNVDLGPKWLEAATHATRSSIDF